MSELKKEVLVEVNGVSKKFCKSLRRSLRYGLADVTTELVGLKGNPERLRKDEFWAVNNVSFELRRGECLGLIGHNGAGKSTLLKMLNGLITPDKGEILLRGRVGALIELGAGFNPILTGRENVYVNGQILGFTRKEIEEKFDEIVAFSELEEFIDSPVQNYSSGMKVRLGFAVASQMEPDILLIDEVLAVGDMGFVLKCLKKIDTILPNTALIFVSHSMPMISRVCNSIVLLEHGMPQFQGSGVARGIDLYYSRFRSNNTGIIFSDGSVELVSMDLDHPGTEKGDYQIQWLDDLIINLALRLNRDIPVPFISVILFDKEQRPVASLVRNSKNQDLSVIDGLLKVQVKHTKLQLSKGIYSVNLSISSSITNEPLLRINDVMSFQVLHEEDVWQPFLLDAGYSDRANDGKL